MIDKAFLEGFMRYLQAYYGAGRDRITSHPTLQGNQPVMPLFQEGSGALEELEEDFGEAGMMAEELNGMFPGPYDPMRLN